MNSVLSINPQVRTTSEDIKTKENDTLIFQPILVKILSSVKTQSNCLRYILYKY